MFSLRAGLAVGAAALIAVALLVVAGLVVSGPWNPAAGTDAGGAGRNSPTAGAGRGMDAEAAAGRAATPGAAGSGGSAGTASADAAAGGRAGGATAGRPPRGAGRIDGAWLARQATVTSVRNRVLLAYVTGAAWADARWKGCRLDWSTLAGIGYVESHHGTIAGSRVGADGVARPAIVGVALDGVKTARIADTDGGRYDGDPHRDRAVGPMQFIPSSWAKHRVDGNADGKENP